MRKSKQVLLSAVLITAVSAIKAQAQDVCVSPLEPEPIDTPVHHGHGYYGGGHGGRGIIYALFHFGRGSHHSQPPHITATTSHPRTGGFGNTLRSSFAGS